LLDIQDSQKLALCCDLIDLKGSANIFHDSKRTNSKDIASFAFAFEKKTKTEVISPKFLESRRIEFADVLEKSTATHIVVGVEKGLKCFINLHFEGLTEKTVTNELLNRLVTGQEDIAEIQGEERLNFTQRRNCSIYSDFQIDAQPSNIAEAINLLHSLPGQLENDDIKDTILTVTLLPLSKFDLKVKNVHKQISSSLIENCIQQFEVLETLKADANDLIQLHINQLFPTLMKKNEEFAKLLDDNLLSLKGMFKSVLPKAQDFMLDKQDELSAIIHERNKSPYNKRALMSWVDETKKQCVALSKILSLLTDDYTSNIQICASEDDLLQHLKEKEEVFIFAIGNLNINNNFLVKMETFTITGNFPDSYMLQAYMKSSFEPLKMAQNFRDFAFTNSQNRKQSFIVSENFLASDDSVEETTKLMFFKHGIEKELFKFPSKPENVKIEKSTQTSVTVVWSEPTFGKESILNYSVSAQEVSLHENSDNVKNKCILLSKDCLHFKLENLKSGTPYQFCIQVKTSFGMGPEARLDFCTLPGPIQNLKACMQNLNIVELSWDIPREVNMCAYQIRLQRKTSCEFEVLKENEVPAGSRVFN